ncbi:MAG: hypothetical protein AAF388_15855, partial [Bacteroidota bacterium]
MTSIQERPLILLTYTNRQASKQRPVSVDQELEEVANSLQPLVDEEICEVRNATNSEEGYFLELVQDEELKSRISIIHLSGGVISGNILLFPDSSGKSKIVEPTKLGAYLGDLPNLKIVFITGIFKPGLVNELLKAGVPSVISIGFFEESYNLPVEYYSQLADSKTLKQAYGYVTIRDDSLQYEVLDVEEEGEITRQAFKPGLYVNRDKKDLLNWSTKLKMSAEEEGEFKVPDINSLPSVRKHRTRKIVMGIALILMVAVGVYGFFTPYTQRLIANFMNQGNCPFPNQEDTYNVLILPFPDGESCGTEDETYKNDILAALEEFQAENNLQLSLMYQYVSCPQEEQAILTLGETCNANLVIWGSHSSNDVAFNYISTNLYDEYLFTGTEGSSFNVSKSSIEGAEEGIYGELEELIFWALGMQKFEQQKYQEAITLFQEIGSLGQNNNNAVDLILTQCYKNTDLYDDALGHFGRLIEK